jgi:hypothetical protein
MRRASMIRSSRVPTPWSPHQSLRVVTLVTTSPPTFDRTNEGSSAGGDPTRQATAEEEERPCVRRRPAVVTRFDLATACLIVRHRISVLRGGCWTVRSELCHRNSMNALTVEWLLDQGSSRTMPPAGSWSTTRIPTCLEAAGPVGTHTHRAPGVRHTAVIGAAPYPVRVRSESRTSV